MSRSLLHLPLTLLRPLPRLVQFFAQPKLASFPLLVDSHTGFSVAFSLICAPQYLLRSGLLTIAVAQPIYDQAHEACTELAARDGRCRQPG
eukprot:6208868-Pleurochrysis_carterae.AAC.4